MQTRMWKQTYRIWTLLMGISGSAMCVQVRHFELSNESWKTCQAAQYAWALLDWAPALKQAHPTALIGANGPAGRTELGERDQGIAWWPQVSTFIKQQHMCLSPGGCPARHFVALLLC